MKKFLVLIYCFLSVIILSIPVYASNWILLNGVFIPNDLYKEIKEYADIQNEAFSVSDGFLCTTYPAELEYKLLSRVKHNKTAYCFNCNIYYPIAEQYSDRIDIDSRFKYDSRICIDGLPYEVTYILPPQCPLCGIMYDREYYSPTEVGQLALNWHTSFQIVRKKGDLWEQYMFTYNSETDSQEENFRRAMFYLKASRSVKLDKIRRKKYLELALNNIRTHIQKIRESGGFWNIQEESSTLVIEIDILRQLENFDEASKSIAQLRDVQITDIKYLYQNLLLDRLETLITEQDSNPALKPFGNKLHTAIRENLPIDSDIKSLAEKSNIMAQINIQGLDSRTQAIFEQRTDYVKLLMSEKAMKLHTYGHPFFVKQLLEVAKRTGNKEIYELVRSAVIREGYIAENETIKEDN